MTPAERLIVNSLVVFVCEDGGSKGADDTLAAMRCGLERLDRMRPPAVEGIVAAAEHIIARVDSGAFVLGQDSRRYARLALADFFTERRNAALNDLA